MTPPAPSPHDAVRRVPLEHIAPSPRNPRVIQRKSASLEELAESMAAYGLLQPVVLREMAEERYELVAGHRRLAAAQHLGWRHIPAVVRQADADEAYLLTLVENLQRQDLTASEEARALEALLRERGWDTRQVAAAIKRSPAYVSKRLRVFEDPVLAPLVLANRLTVSAAEELLPLVPERRKALARQAADEGWDHARVRAAARGGAARGGRFESKQRTVAGLSRQARDLRRSLRSILPSDLSEVHRRELRLLFMELLHVARAPAERKSVVLPALPRTPAARPGRAVAGRRR